MEPEPNSARRNRVYCRSCGASERVRGDSFPLGWSIIGGGKSGKGGYLCPTCARMYLREIEGKLDLDFEAGLN